MGVIYWRVKSLLANQNEVIGYGFTLDVLQDTGQSDEVLVSFLNTVSDPAVIEAACVAAVESRMANEWPLVDVTEIRRVF